MKNTFSKRDERVIKHSTILKFAGILIILVGLVGVLVGLHKLFILNTITTRNYDKIFTAFSFGIICFGYVIHGAFRTIEKLKNIRNNRNSDGNEI